MYTEGQVYLPAKDIVSVLGGQVAASTLRTWKERGLLKHHGRNRYDLGEVLNLLETPMRTPVLAH